MPIRRSPNDARYPRPQPGRDPPEQVVAINRNAWSQSSGARKEPCCDKWQSDRFDLRGCPLACNQRHACVGLRRPIRNFEYDRQRVTQFNQSRQITLPICSQIHDRASLTLHQLRNRAIAGQSNSVMLLIGMDCGRTHG